jgi:hypothetical protein
MAERKKLVKVLTFVAVLAAAALLRLWLVPAQLPYHYVADEFQVIERTLRVGAGNPNPGLFTWPGSLVIYLNFVLFAAYFAYAFLSGAISSASEFARLYWTDPSAFYLLGRLLSTAFGLAAVGGVYYITVRLFKLRTGGNESNGHAASAGLIAAASFALMPQAITSSAQALPDMAATSLAVAALAVSLRPAGKKPWATSIPVGLLLGLAAASKYHAVLYIIPIGVIIFTKPGNAKITVKRIALLVSSIIAGFVVACPFSVLDFPSFAGDVNTLLARPGMVSFKCDPLYLITTTLPLGMSWPLFVFGTAGIIWCVTRRAKGVRLITALLVLSFLIPAIPRPLPPRHLLPLYPAFAAAGGILAADVYRQVGKRFGRRLASVPVVLTTIIVFIAGFGAVRLVTWENREDSRTSALKFIDDTIPAGAAILTESVEPDVTSPFLRPDRNSIERIGKYRRKEGLGGGERAARLLAEPAYPFGKPAYNVYLVEMHDDLDALEVEYAVRCIPDDERYFAEQAKPPGTSLNEWDGRYARFLRERGEVVATFSGGERPGPTVEIYRVKR